MFFKDRRDAGEKLISSFLPYQKAAHTLVLGLARGGVVVADAVAKGLSLPLNVVVPRKIGAPWQKELAIGAIAEGGQVFLNERLIQILGVPQKYLEAEIAHEQQVALERIKRFRKNLPLPDLKGWQVLLVDDGIATGATMLAVIESMRKLGAKKIIVAVPTSSVDAYNAVESSADEIVSLIVDPAFQAVGQYYDSFDQTEDDEVIKLLQNSQKQ